MPIRPSHQIIRRFFAGIAESTFQTELGVADPPLVDYVSDLLARFVRCDAIFRLRDLRGQRLSGLVAMRCEAEARIGEAKREAHRHIGDFTLFWTGVYPEALRSLQSCIERDHLLDYRAEGKRSYYIASTIPSADDTARTDVLHRLSDQFELCQYALNEIRREWERRDDDGPIELIRVNE
jgi:hypothetical protein